LFVDEEFGAEWPNLYEWMRETTWEDGTKRLTGAIMLTVDNGYLKCWIHDKDGARSAWVSGEGWLALLKKVDESLASGALEWRPDKRR